MADRNNFQTGQAAQTIDILNCQATSLCIAIFYRADNGIKWRALPRDFPAWQTVYGYFRLWVRLGIWEQINRALVQQVRMKEGREAEPSLGIIDSQSVKLGQKGGRNKALMATSG